MRIVGGAWRGRRLAAPRGDAIRPTSDRLREALFNVLAHAYGDPVPGARVLDLFAGTGALAFEALSRGAALAVLVDEGAQAGALIRETREALGCADRARLLRRDATRLGTAEADGPFTLAFLDPPYGRGLAPRALACARDGGWLAPDALVLVEEAASVRLGPLPGFTELERRGTGETAVTVLRAAG